MAGLGLTLTRWVCKQFACGQTEIFGFTVILVSLFSPTAAAYGPYLWSFLEKKGGRKEKTEKKNEKERKREEEKKGREIIVDIVFIK